MGPQFASTTSEGILLTMFTEKKLYLPGEPVGMTLVKVNYSSRPVRLFYPTSQRFDFIVTKRGRELWRWSHGRYFLQLAETLILKPLESQVYQVTWLQNTNDFASVSPGTYTLAGMNVAKELRIQPVEVTVVIK